MATRKRRAPGASPIAQQNAFPDDGATTADTYMNNWEPASGAADMNGFGDGTIYDQLREYSTNFSQQPPTHNRVVSLDRLNDGVDMGAGTLVRRNQNQQLAARGRSPWGDPFNAQGQSGAWENTDDDEELERKAAIAKKDASAKRKTIPPFVQKLSSFLDNGNNTNLIRWSDDGNSFIVLDEDEFARTLIPELFKHNNYASFVRQLNMYGFHKKVGLSDNSMKASETKAKAPSEYFNKYFKRGRPELLWLIQKPKNTPAGPKRRKDDDAKGDSDEDRKFAPDGGGGYVEELAVRGNNQEMAMIPRSEYNSLRAEVRTLQQQQKVISNVLSQIRRQNEQLYQQATAFQTLHDRHENSINAILTFLATFYNRSLEGNTNNINIADMFGPAMPNQQPQGSVVDMENYTEAPITKSPHVQKKTPMKLLPAPPTRHVHTVSPRAKTVSPRTSAAPTPLATPDERPAVFRSNMPQARNAAARQTNSVSTFGVPLKVEANSPSNQVNMTLPENDEIMSAIQTANANASAGGYSQAPQIDLPAALNSYQHQDGHTPLTPQQRNDVLSLMAHNTSAASPHSAFAANTNNALNNPQPPPMPNLDQLQETEAQLAYLQRVSEEQNSRVQSLQERLQPLSPSGQIPGLDANNSYFGNALGDPGQYDLNHDLDLDSFVQGDDFFPTTTQEDGMGLTAADPTLPDLNYELTGDNSGFGEAAGDRFDFGDGDGHLGVKDANVSGTVESVSSSATSPASATVEEVEDESRRRSPKRRKK